MIRRHGLHVLVLVASALLAPGCGEDPAPPASFTRSIVDAATGRPTPARVELLDAAGRAVQPASAMPGDSSLRRRPAAA